MSKENVLVYAQIAIAVIIVALWAWESVRYNGGMTVDELLHLLIGLGIATGGVRGKLNGQA